MSKWKLVIDAREKISTHSFFDEHPSKLFFEIDKKKLDIGDFLIQKDDNDILLFERKTIPDLLASLRDGRYSEQKKRMVAFNCVHRGYIIEGKIDSHPIILQLIIRMFLKDRFMCFVVKNTYGTLNLVSEIIRKCSQDSKLYQPLNVKINEPNNEIQENQENQKNCENTENSEHSENTENTEITEITEITENTEINKEYIKCLSVVKKDNITPQTCFIMQLKQIPGISDKTAFKIYEYNSSWKSLIEKFENNADDELYSRFDKKIQKSKIKLVRNFCMY
jgi:ERCC4-type nuclease